MPDPVISDDEIAEFRGLVTDLALPDVCDVERETKTSDGAGSSTLTWSTHLSNEPCRIKPSTRRQGGGEPLLGSGETADRIVEETTHVVTFSAETDIEEADRIVFEGQTFNVTVVRKKGKWEMARQVEVVEAPGHD